MKQQKSKQNDTKKKNKASALPKKEQDSAVLAIAITLAIFLLAGAVIGIVALARRPMDLFDTRMSRFLKLDESKYANMTLTVKLDAVDEAAVTRRIYQTLCEHKSDRPLNNGESDRTVPIRVGDEVILWYRGYYMENGVRVEFDGGNNILAAVEDSTEEKRTLEIGSGLFIPGFEEGLIGVRGDVTSDLVRDTKGTVAAGDVVYLQMSAMFPDGTAYANKTVRVDLSDPDLGKKYGADFAEKIVGKEIGKKLGNFTSELVDAPEGLSTAIYMDVTVRYRTRGEDTPLTVEAYFPANYDSEELAGRTVYFEVYINKVVRYETPEADDVFVSATLGLSAEDLKEYAGSSLSEKYRAYVRAELVSAYEQEYEAAVQNAVFDYLESCITVRRIPSRAVRPVYEQYLVDLQTDYEYYKSYGYTSIEQYAADALALGEGETYKDYLWNMAQQATREKMSFYLLMQHEDIVPTKEEREQRIEAAKQETLAYYRDEVYAADFVREDYKSDAEYDAAVAELWEAILAYHGESYFEESADYDVVMEHVLRFAKINVVGKPWDM